MDRKPGMGRDRTVTVTVLATFFFGITSSLFSADTSFELIAIHPDAATQDTDVGRTLHTLHVAGGKIFVGYGDFAVNTGPISLRYFDPRQHAFSDSLVVGNTEAFHRFRTIGDQVFAPTTDPLAFTTGGYYVGSTDGSASWKGVDHLDGIHFFDIAAYGNSTDHLFLSGSGGPTDQFHSIVYESLDGGRSWQVALDVPVPDLGDSTLFTRFYGMGQLGKKLYVQQVLVGRGWEALSIFSYDGTRWTEEPVVRTSQGNMTQFVDPDLFMNELILRDSNSGLKTSPMFRFNGSSLAEITAQGLTNGTLFWDQFVDGDTLYVLTDDQMVLSTQDFSSWETIVADVPDVIRSLAVIDNDLYFGGKDASLYRYSMLVPEPCWGTLQFLSLVVFSCAIRRHKNGGAF